ncbi:MAG: deoxyribodipyrimidine photo-lyase [Gammaproteobacteria bacterium]
MTTAIVWFRRDLRLADNPALQAACRHADRLIPLFVWSPGDEAPWQPGAASRWWLHHSLERLNEDLARLGNPLVVRPAGRALDAIRDLVEAQGVEYLYWNRLYDPALVARDKALKQWALEAGLTVESFRAGVLSEPWEVANGRGDPYRVFTPFWKAARSRDCGAPIPAPKQLPMPPAGLDRGAVASLGLLPGIRWDAGLAATWRPGEAGGHDLLEDFADGAAERYGQVRDLPAEPGTSRLSPYLHFGEVSPRQALRLIERVQDPEAAQPWLRQLYWREFGHHLLFHFPHTAEAPLDPRFADFPWADDEPALAAWQAGTTGIPMVDAGMRELWHTGWMHNRVRMLVASLLTKNLLLPWQAGARWFWDTLVDADLANNSLGWQWTAGCGADAAPYFRIFNPALQGERFDPRGHYVRRWVPELAQLPERWLHRPWEAPQAVLDTADVRLGRDYPRPLVDLAESRAAALDVWEDLKATNSPA